MKHPRSLPGLAATLLGVVAFAACSTDLPVDSKCPPGTENDRDCNPGVLSPVGVVRGTISYLGPGPCIRDGRIEGVAIALLFDAQNPPPPDGLATTAVNFATVPGEKLFASFPRPATGPGSKGHPESYCPPLSSGPVAASADFALTQLPAGRYQVRGFYSRQNRFNPVFDFANLPLAGDIGGGVLVDARAAAPKFATIQVGLPDKDGALHIPEQGFVVSGVSMVLGQVLATSRPWFSIDFESKSTRAFGGEQPAAAAEATTGIAYPTDAITKGVLTFPQAHPLTGDLASAEASFPAVHLRFGFPGDPKQPKLPFDAWLARNAKPADPFAGAARPFYGIDPTDALTTEAAGFTMTRAFQPDGAPAVLHDNSSLEALRFAQLFPLVVLAKLAEGDDGLPIDPPTPQTNPVVILQGITLRKDSMLATSGVFDGTGLSSDTVAPTTEEIVAEFTSLIRTAALCLDPTKGLQGTLAVPYFKDFNPASKGGVLVEEALIKATQPLVKEVKPGCLPPGWYSINVVYPSGQAWGVPNQMGACVQKETCRADLAEITASEVSAGFLGDKGRPLLVSQQVLRTEGGKKVPQVLYVAPSPRCMKNSGGVWTNNPFHEDKNGNGFLDAGERDEDGNGSISLRIPDACWPAKVRSSKGELVDHAFKQADLVLAK